MQKLRFGLIAIWLILCSGTAATAQVSIGIGIPNLSIGINLPLLPELVPVPGYPVYYAPRVNANYFFYDGLYWVFQDDNWYASSWYNGPWGVVEPEAVPLYILRIPVRYYRQPPHYFRGWRANAPPRWGEHWGPEWEQHRRGWSKWKRGSAPAPAPLPLYQREYSRDRYPGMEQQQRLRSEHYRFQPRETVNRRFYREQRAPAPAQRRREERPPVRGPEQRNYQRPMPPPQGGTDGPRSQQPRRGGENLRGPAPGQPPAQQRGPVFKEQRPQHGGEQRNQQGPGSPGQEQRSQERVKPQESDRGHGQGPGRDVERGRERNN
jgi:hypothetical protein